jgi:tetratricopeptide (TPR) repeat protein
MMKKRHIIFTIFLPLLLSCQSNNSALPTHAEFSSNLLLDDHFSIPAGFLLETEEEIFKLDDEMTELVQKKLISGKTARYKAHILLDHIFNEENISLKYDGNANVTASQAYHSQTANCMSLTIMAYALAHEAGINVNFQQVDVPEYWVRNGQHNLLTGHVNLVVKEDTAVDRNIIWGEKRTQIDFDPYVAKENFPKKEIKKNTVLAMFYNNKGAQALIQKNYSVAYQYFKAAVKQDKFFSSAWGNLGVLYKYTNDFESAEKVYRHALMLKNDNLTALKNLSLLLKNKEMEDEAQKIDDYLHETRKFNPYYYALLADEALYQKNYNEAEVHYRKAIRLEDKRHEFYLGLAKVYYKLNKLSAAKRAMKKAIDLNDVSSINQRYIAKLNFLKHSKNQLN